MAGLTPASLSAEAPVAPAAVVETRKKARFSPWQEAWRRFRRHRLALVSGVVLLLIVAAIADRARCCGGCRSTRSTSASKLEGPTWAHPFGTDDLGQDVLARLLYGGRISLAVGLAAMLVAITVGVLVGAAGRHVERLSSTPS